MLGKIEGKGTEDEMVRWHHRLNGLSLSKFQEMVKDREAWHAAAHEVTKSQTRLRDRRAIGCHKNSVGNILIL